MGASSSPGSLSKQCATMGSIPPPVGQREFETCPDLGPIYPSLARPQPTSGSTTRTPAFHEISTISRGNRQTMDERRCRDETILDWHGFPGCAKTRQQFRHFRPHTQWVSSQSHSFLPVKVLSRGGWGAFADGPVKRARHSPMRPILAQGGNGTLENIFSVTPNCVGTPSTVMMTATSPPYGRRGT